MASKNTKKSSGNKISAAGAISNKPKSSWNINISVAENGYVVRVSRNEKDQWVEYTFIATSEKELNAIVEKYK